MPQDQETKANPPGLEEILKGILERLTALENKPAINVSSEHINNALSDHPVIADFRAFLEKWGH